MDFNNIDKRKLIILLAIVGGILLILILSLALMKVGSSLQTKVTPTSVPSPTRYYSQSWQPVNSLNALKATLRTPTMYKGITIEYRSKSGTFVVFHQVSQSEAQSIARSFFQRYALDITQLKVVYLDLNPPNVTVPPNGFFR